MSSRVVVVAPNGSADAGVSGADASLAVMPSGGHVDSPPRGATESPEKGGSGCNATRACLMMLAMCFMSSGGTAFALVEGVPPLLKASWRVWATSFVELPFFLYQFYVADSETRLRWRKQWLGLFVSGAFLAVHFMSWVWGIDHTSLAHSLLWVSSHPLVVVSGMFVGSVMARMGCCRRAFGSVLDRASRPVALEAWGAVVGFLGGAIMVLDAGSNDTGVTVIGDAVSFLGAVSMAVYLAVGGVMRNWMPLFLYAFPVTLAASVVATATSAAVEGTTLLGTDGDAAFGWLFNTEWVLLVLYQGFGPGLLGHTMVNYLLEHISPLLVSVVLLMEPLFGSVIGFAFDKQGVPGLWTFLGGPVLIAGAVMVIVGQHRRPAAGATHEQAAIAPAGRGDNDVADGSVARNPKSAADADAATRSTAVSVTTPPPAGSGNDEKPPLPDASHGGDVEMVPL